VGDAVKHNPCIVEDHDGNLRGGCSCGWRSDTFRDDDSGAMHDAMRHVAEVTT
jgi:hypothetical protein